MRMIETIETTWTSEADELAGPSSYKTYKAYDNSQTLHQFNGPLKYTVKIQYDTLSDSTTFVNTIHNSETEKSNSVYTTTTGQASV